jgi:hypothetical protein
LGKTKTTWSHKGDFYRKPNGELVIFKK